MEKNPYTNNQNKNQPDSTTYKIKRKLERSANNVVKMNGFYNLCSNFNQKDILAVHDVFDVPVLLDHPKFKTAHSCLIMNIALEENFNIDCVDEFVKSVLEALKKRTKDRGVLETDAKIFKGQFMTLLGNLYKFENVLKGGPIFRIFEIGGGVGFRLYSFCLSQHEEVFDFFVFAAVSEGKFSIF